VSVEPAADASDGRPKPVAQDRSPNWTERAKAWVERSCAEQGVPVKLSDLIALQRIADILGEAREAREGAGCGDRAA
jgi:hypothetical protein